MRLLQFAVIALVVGAFGPDAAAQAFFTVSASRSASNTTVISITQPFIECYEGIPLAPTVSRSGNVFTLHSVLYLAPGCFPVPPATPPYTRSVDVGFLTPGSYDVIWTLAHPTRGLSTLRATFTVAQDQHPLAVPTLSPLPLAALVATWAMVGWRFARAQGTQTRTRPRASR